MAIDAVFTRRNARIRMVRERKPKGFVLWAWSQRPRVILQIWHAIVMWKRFVFTELPFLRDNWNRHWFVCDDCGKKFNGNAEGGYGCRDFQCGRCINSDTAIRLES